MEAAALWGAQCNRHGMLDQVTEEIRIEHKGYAAAIGLYRTAKGYWHVALEFFAPMSGFATPASVWTAVAYTSDIAARRAAIQRILSCSAVKKDGSGKAGDLRAFRAKLEGALTPQLALF